MKKRNKLIALGIVSSLTVTHATPLFAQLLAQSPNDFLEDDDFDSTPPGAYQPNPGNPAVTPPPIDPMTGRNNTPSGTPGNPPTTPSFTPPSTPGSANPRFGEAKSRARPKMATANPEDITDENFPDLIDSFDYPNAEVSDVIKAMSELTGKNFIVDPQVRGKITIMAPTRITVAEAYKAFLSALAINGFTVVPSGKFLKILPARTALKDSIDIYTGAYTPNTDQIITRVVQLKHISAADFNKNLGRLASANGVIDIYEPTNTLIISDFGSNVERIMKIVSQIDVIGFDEQLAVIPIRHAKAADIADLIDQIINKGQSKKQRGAPGSFTAGIPRFGGPDQKSNQAYSMVIPDERTNAIIVVGNAEGIKKIQTLVKQLDFDIPADEAGGVFVYYVKHGNAEDISKTLTGLVQQKNEGKTGPGSGSSPNPFPPPPGFGFGGETPTSGAAGGFLGGNVKITFAKETNSLIVTASKQDYETVLSILAKIDIPRDQVYIEAIIMEMKTGNTNNVGVNYYSFAPGTNGAGRVGFAGSPPVTNLLNLASDSGAILGFGAGGTVDITGPDGKVLKIPSLLGFLNFLKSVTDTNILSTPQVLAMDNEKSVVEVGDEVPVGQTSTATAAGSTTSVTFKDATTKLEITPHISKNGETIRMLVDQSVTAVGKTEVQAKNLAESTATLNKRRVTSNIIIENGDTAVIGGLMREADQNNVRKVPILGDIPLIGWFFRATDSFKEKLNLLVFITPRIIRNRTDQAKNMVRKLEHRVDFIKANLGGRDPNGKQFDEMAKKADATLSKEEPTDTEAEPAEIK